MVLVEVGAAMVLILVVVGFVCWYCSNWENRFSIGLIGGLGSIQSSPRENVEDAEGSSSVSVS